MSLRTIYQSNFASVGNGLTLGANEIVHIIGGVTIAYEGTSNFSAVFSNAGNVGAIVSGTVSGDFAVDFEGAHSRVDVSTYGLIVGGMTGVYLTNGGDADSPGAVSNAGYIFGGSNGLVLEAGNFRIMNTGEIASDPIYFFTSGSAIRLNSAGGEISNTGVITGLNGISSAGLGASNLGITIHNSGTINAAHFAIDLSSGTDDRLVNSGLIKGMVNLGGGADTYDGAGGRVVGSIDLGIGNDTATGGDRADVFLGLALDDNDVIDGAGGLDSYDASAETAVGMRANLGGGTIRFPGAATLDYVFSIERVLGTQLADTLRGGGGSETLTGNSGGDSLYGGGGKDLLYGGDGNDWLDGGAGDDTMAGGPGNDRFYGGAGNDNMIVDDGQDTLTGGAGADEFVIASVDRDILGKFLPHLITDFRHGEDLIDVSIADAKSSVAGNNVFSFVGTQAPSAEGQLGYTVLGGVTRVWINETSGTPERHVILELTGSIALTADDFVL